MLKFELRKTTAMKPSPLPCQNDYDLLEKVLLSALLVT